MDHDNIILSGPDLGAIELECEVWGEPVENKGEVDDDEDEDNEA